MEEFCKYLLEKDCSKPYMKKHCTNGKYKLKTQIIKMADLRFCKGYNIFKEKDSDKRLLDVFEHYLDSKIVFFDMKKSAELDSLLKSSQAKYIIERKKYKKGENLSYETLFDVAINLLFIISSTYNALRHKKKIVTFSTNEECIDAFISAFVKYIDIWNNENQRYHDEIGKAGMFELLFWKYKVSTQIREYGYFWNSLALINGMDANSFDDKYSKYECNYESEIFMYFAFIILATYTRYEEIREECGYGW